MRRPSEPPRVPALGWVILAVLVLAGPAMHAGAQSGPVDAPPRVRALERLAASGRASEALVEAYRERDRVPVVVVMKAPRRGATSRAERRNRIRERGDQVLADCPPEDFRMRHRFRHTPGIAGELHLRAAVRLARNPAVEALDLDVGGSGMLVQAMAVTGGHTANTNAFIGTGVTVATLDSGVDTDHTDLASALVDEHCRCPSCCPTGTSPQSGPGSAEDDNRHGTLVAGVAVSRGVLASVGMAPDSDLIAVKVLDDDLFFQLTSDIAAGLEWLVDNHTVEPPGTSALRVVNMSLATAALFDDNAPGDCLDLAAFLTPLADQVDELESRGVLVVAAAGNSGNTTQLPAPACLSNVISVGALWDSEVGPAEEQLVQTSFGCSDPMTGSEEVACFSNAPAHTDIMAPGAAITGPSFALSAPFDPSIGVSAGTSFASPFVAGCAALLFAQQPTRTPADVRALLLGSSTVITDSSTGFSFPRLDCAEALGLGPDDADDDFDDITVGEGDNCPAVPNPVQGDVELDGYGDRCDVCIFVEDPDQTDTDMDGLGDACECTGALLWPGDVDGSGLVDGTDLFILEFNFGRDDGVGPANGDQNCDGIIDGADYTLWADHLGRSNTEADLP